MITTISWMMFVAGAIIVLRPESKLWERSIALLFLAAGLGYLVV